MARRIGERMAALALVVSLGAMLAALPAEATGPKDLMAVIKNTSSVAEERLDLLAQRLHDAYESDGPEGMEAAIDACYIREDKAAGELKKSVAVECFLLDEAGELLYRMLLNKRANQGRPVLEPKAYFVDDEEMRYRRLYGISHAFTENEAKLFPDLAGNGHLGIIIRVHNLRAKARIATDASPLGTVRFPDAWMTQFAEYYDRVFREYGMSGVEQAISECYEDYSRARPQRKPRLASCLALDRTAEGLHQGYLAYMASVKLQAEPLEFFEEAAMRQRRAKYLDPEFPDDELIEWMGKVEDEVIRRIGVIQSQRGEPGPNENDTEQ